MTTNGLTADGVKTDQEMLSGTALAVFRLNGQFLAVVEELARPAGLSAARWQVLGAVLTTLLPVAGIARVMGSRARACSASPIFWSPTAWPSTSRTRSPGGRSWSSPPLRGTRPFAASIMRTPFQARRLAERLGREELSATLAALVRLASALDAPV